MLEQVAEFNIEQEIEKKNPKEFLKVLSRLGYVVSTVVNENNSYNLSLTNGKTMTLKVSFEGDDQEKLIITDLNKGTDDDFVKNFTELAKEKGGFIDVNIKK